MPQPKRRTKKKEDEKPKDTSPTVFTAAGLLAFSEEEALIKIKPVHVISLTVAFILAVVLATIL
jgi:preprotein translocase subunit Sec61beta